MNNKIIVLGANGQLGNCLQLAAKNYPQFSFRFLGSKECNITSPTDLERVINLEKPNFCINAAAYTQVDLAEDEKENAFEVNAIAVEQLAKLCNQHQVELIHVSTDYVFDGTQNKAYKETDPTGPINVYGASKLQGEFNIQNNMNEYYILRTSWLYSQFGANFLKSMLNKVGSGLNLKITTEQKGCPTNANDLAEAILTIISSPKKAFGIYHFSNTEVATWYEFAQEIFKNANALDTVSVSPTDFYPTKAKRPNFSVMNTSKIQETFNLNIKDWKTSLADLQAQLN